MSKNIYILGTQTIFFNELGEILIAKRAKNKKIAPERWNFIGGKIESGESPTEGAIREIKEEINIDIKEDDLLPVQIKNVSWEKSHLFQCFTYLSKIDKSSNIEINNEHTDYKWITIFDIEKYNIVGYKKSEIIELLKLGVSL